MSGYEKDYLKYSSRPTRITHKTFDKKLCCYS